MYKQTHKQADGLYIECPAAAELFLHTINTARGVQNAKQVWEDLKNCQMRDVSTTHTQSFASNCPDKCIQWSYVIHSSQSSHFEWCTWWSAVNNSATINLDKQTVTLRSHIKPHKSVATIIAEKTQTEFNGLQNQVVYGRLKLCKENPKAVCNLVLTWTGFHRWSLMLQKEIWLDVLLFLFIHSFLQVLFIKPPG